MADPRPERRAIIVFTKAPRRGEVKTRIAAKMGDDCALAIYMDLLRKTSQTLGRFDHHVAYTGARDARPLAAYFPKAASFFRQRGKTLGARQKNAFLHCAALGYTRFCLVGCDCPRRTARDIAGAFIALDKGYDAAIGPATDGGYHLVAGSLACTGLFDVKGWGTPRLMAETLRAAKRLGLRCRLLEPKSDIDTCEAYFKWKAAAR